MTAPRILVVEDQNIIAMDLQSRLHELGYAAPLAVSSGEEAIQASHAHLPDLILMDIRLKGGIDGIQAAATIRSELDLPIIYLTAHSDDQTLERAQATEPHGYLLKPFEDRELRLTIEMALYKHRVERQLKENERWLSAVLQGIGEAVIATDGQGGIRLVNPVAAALIGLSPADALGRPIDEIFALVDAQTRARLDNPIRRALRERRTVIVPERALLIGRDGREVPIDDSASPIFDARGQVVGGVLVFRDITERLHAEQQLKHLAYHDPLTGLPNRALFQILANRAATASERAGAAVLFMDLDRFKTINDSLGHGFGDLLLKTVTARIAGILQDGALLARFGGDEFTVLLENVTSPAEASTVAEEILGAFAEPFELDGQEVYVGVSIGISLAPDDGSDAATLIRNAAAAVLGVKERGRNGFGFYRSEMNASALSRLTLDADLRHALERGQFRLHYQPMVAIGSARLVSVEALIRWQHPSLGLVPPARFLELAEETGLIIPIGQWVLQTACRQAQIWRTSVGLESLRVAINLSNRQFRQPDLVLSVASALAETGLPPEALELELTETIIIHDRADSLAKIAALKQMGVRLALDDFGTGYSSLEHLKLFQVDTLKIDRAFVRSAHIDREDEAIVQAIVTLAHGLGIAVTAEGIESDEQQACMTRCGCDEGQGFLFGRPLPPEDLSRRFASKVGAVESSEVWAMP